MENANAIFEIKGLSKDFGGLRALNDLFLEIHEGDIFGIIGPNGSGKTTWLNVVTGFLRPTAGSIVFKGQSIVGWPPSQIAKRGLLRTFQLTSLFPNLTAEQNIIAGRHLETSNNVLMALFNTRNYRKEEMELREKADEIMSFMEMQERRDVLAKNLLSVEQRKLEIAIALAAEPELLLLDEPASGMNIEEATRLISLIRSIHQMGITIGIIEHNMRLVMGLCSRIAVLNYGEKIAEGTPQEIANNEEVISVYLGGEETAQG